MVILSSHGFKYSRPDANFVFDVSYFKNPWREKSIREEKDKKKQSAMILDFMSNQEGSKELLDRIAAVIRLIWLLHPEETIKVALCCSAGEYRSPAMVELLAKKLTLGENINVRVTHSPEAKI